MVDFSRMRYPLVLAKPAKAKGGVEVSAFRTQEGQTILTNATARPFSPINGEPMARIETASVVTLPADAMKNYVTIASCSNRKCGCTLMAHSEVADAIEIEGKPIHCVLCNTEVTPDIDLDDLLRAMSADQSADDAGDEDDFDAPTADDGPDGEQVKVVEKAAGNEDTDIVQPEPDAEAKEKVGDNDDLPEPGAAGADENGKDPETPAKLVETVKAGKDCDADSDEDDADSDKDDEKKEEAHDYDGDGVCDDIGDEGDADSDEDDDYPDYFADGDDEDDDEGDYSDDDSDDGDQPDADDSEQGDDVPADDKAEKAAITVKEAANMSVNLAATVDFSRGRVELVPSDAGYYVMHNGAPVATLLREKAAADLQDIFDKQVFASAFATEVASGLKAENVARFGFQPITITVEVEKAMEVAMQETASAQQSEVASKNAAYMDAVRQGLSIVSVGSIKNVWDEFANPIREGMVADLKKLGVYDPEGIVDRNFAQHGAAYHQVVLSKALELAEKSDEIRNETARLVEKAKARVLAPNQADALAGHLAKGGLPALALGGQKKETAAAAPKEDDFTSRLGKIVGRL